jgi:hypothetical protein
MDAKVMWITLLCLVLAVACESDTDDGNTTPMNDAAADGDADADADVDGDIVGDVDADGSDATTKLPPEEVPFAVDDAFFLSGFMGTGSVEGGIVETATDVDCGGEARQGEGSGMCHNFVLTQKGEDAWGGVFWQYPGNNWCGDTHVDGLEIEPGATEISFYAWGAAGGEVVTFAAGDEDLGTTGRNCDGFVIRKEVTLTTTPTRYTLSLTTEAQYDGLATYADVSTGFGFSVGGLDEGDVEFFVDDIRWQ